MDFSGITEVKIPQGNVEKITETSGGRVLGVTAVADSLQAALDESYATVKQIHFDNAYYRHDIGKRALEAE